jgi:membrane protein required for colicin V production
MTLNWLDYILLIVIAASVFSGFKLGFARAGVGIAATLVGFLAGAWFYGSAAFLFADWVSSRALANLLGFLTVFFGVQIAGAVLGRLMAMLFKWIGLSWLDRLLGGAFGLARGTVIGIIIVMALVALAPNPPPRAVVNSSIAPYLAEASNLIVALTPRELKDSFAKGYEQAKREWNEILKRKNIPPAKLERSSG